MSSHLVVLAVGVLRDVFRFFQLRFEERNTLVVRKAAALESFAVPVVYTSSVIQCRSSTIGSWWRSIVVRPPVMAGELSLSRARLTAGRVTT